TLKVTPAPTPAPTPSPEATPTPTPSPEPTPTPSPVPAGFTLRVVERASSQSLLEMIVTGVTGFFFGG
ncbi:MAG: hypothetical protein ACXWXR_05970, partial [Candidatus Limnocylindrales bacterium]